MSGHVLWVLIGVFAKSEHVQAGGSTKPANASANASSWSTRPTGGDAGGGGGGDGQPVPVFGVAWNVQDSGHRTVR